jgi:hypothetical protein
MGSGFEDCVYYHFFTIIVNYNSSHIELHLNDVCLTNTTEESLTNLSLLSESLNSQIDDYTAFYNCHATRTVITMSYSQLSSVILFHPLPRNTCQSRSKALIPPRVLVATKRAFNESLSNNELCSGSPIPAFRRHVKI